MKLRQLLHPELMASGSILYHSGRKHYYMVCNETQIKTELGWVEGVSYRRTYRFQGEWIPDPTNLQVYTRPLSLFDKDDWSILAE